MPDIRGSCFCILLGGLGAGAEAEAEAVAEAFIGATPLAEPVVTAGDGLLLSLDSRFGVGICGRGLSADGPSGVLAGRGSLLLFSNGVCLI